MSKKRRKFTKEQRDQAVDDYVSGARSANQIAKDLDTDVQNIYRWKTMREEKAKGVRIDELMEEGRDRQSAEIILNLELEKDEYKKKLAEQIVMVDLLKKIHYPSQQESELTGLIRTTRKSGRKGGRAK